MTIDDYKTEPQPTEERFNECFECGERCEKDFCNQECYNEFKRDEL